MPRGPKGEKRPADVIGNAVHVMWIATGEIQEDTPAKQGREYARKGGLKGGAARGVSDKLWSMTGYCRDDRREAAKTGEAWALQECFAKWRNGMSHTST